MDYFDGTIIVDLDKGSVTTLFLGNRNITALLSSVPFISDYNYEDELQYLLDSLRKRGCFTAKHINRLQEKP